MIEDQAKQGVDYLTIHAGVLLPSTSRSPRTASPASCRRGGSLLAKWMIHHHKQNFLYEHFDASATIMRKYDVTFSPRRRAPPRLPRRRERRRPVRRARHARRAHARSRGTQDVQVMIEGPGHVPHRPDREEHGAAAARSATRRRSTRSGRSSPTSPPATTTSRARIGAAIDRLARRRHALLRHAQGAPRPAEQGRREAGAHRLQDRRPRRRRRQRPPGRAGPRRRAVSRARFEFDWNEQFALALDPGDRARA